MTEPRPTCRDLLEYLADYLDGELSVSKIAIFELHLEECPPCVEYIETYRSAILLARRCIPKPHSEEAYADCPEDLIRAVIEARSGRPPSSRS